MIHDQLRAIAPELNCNVIAIAESQEEFLTIYAGLVRNPGYAAPNGKWNTILLAFRPDDAQRKAIAEGADVYVSLLTFGGPMPGIIVQVDKDSAAAAYNVPALERER